MIYTANAINSPLLRFSYDCHFLSHERGRSKEGLFSALSVLARAENKGKFNPRKVYIGNNSKINTFFCEIVTFIFDTLPKVNFLLFSPKCRHLFLGYSYKCNAVRAALAAP